MKEGSPVLMPETLKVGSRPAASQSAACAAAAPYQAVQASGCERHQAAWQAWQNPICCDRGRAPSKGWANSRLQQPGRASRRDEESLRRVRQEQTEDKGLHMYGTVIKCVAVWPVCGRTHMTTSDGQYEA